MTLNNLTDLYEVEQLRRLPPITKDVVKYDATSDDLANASKHLSTLYTGTIRASFSSKILLLNEIFNSEFKRKLIEEYNKGISIKQLSRENLLPESLVNYWITGTKPSLTRTKRKRMMNANNIKEKTRTNVANYLKQPSSDCSVFTIGTDENGIPIITIAYDADNHVPGHCLESCLWFHNTVVEARAYYSEVAQNLVKNSDNRAELLEVLNFINARLWPVNGSITPRFYLTEDSDITYTALFDYSMFEAEKASSTLEYIRDMITFLAKLSYSIFGVVRGVFDSETAIEYIKSEFLNE